MVTGDYNHLTNSTIAKLNRERDREHKDFILAALSLTPSTIGSSPPE